VAAATVGISVADGEAGVIEMVAPVLERHHAGMAEVLREMPYLSRFPASLDPSPFARTMRFHEPLAPPAGPLPPSSEAQWWADGMAERPLVP
jgi:hypothetical protein